MSEEISPSQKIIAFIAIPLFLLAVDLPLLYLQPQSFAISHFSIAVLTAQMLSLLVFLKGKICPGQRGRLVFVNQGLFLFWGVWLALGALTTYHYVATALVSLCGLALTLIMCLQPKKKIDRRPLIYLAMGIGSIGLLAYGLSFADLHWLYLPVFNPIAQLFTGLVLAHLSLRLAKNRLHNLMAILPMPMLGLLLLNAIFSLFIYANLDLALPNPLALNLYFALHLVCLIVIALPKWLNKQLDLWGLTLLLILAESLPLWAMLSYLKG